MMNFESCEINNIVIHDIGNKYEDGKLRLSESCFLPDDMDVHNLLKSYFLAPFKKDAYYQFAPIEDNYITIWCTMRLILFSKITRTFTRLRWILLNICSTNQTIQT